MKDRLTTHNRPETKKTLSVKPDLSSLRILVVDVDESSQADILSRGLFLFNYGDAHIVNSNEALRILKSSAGDSIDLVLMKTELPGHEIMSIVFDFETARPEVPVIVITNNLFTTRPIAVNDMGLSVLSSPFDMDKLDYEIRKHTLQRGL